MAQDAVTGMPPARRAHRPCPGQPLARDGHDTRNSTPTRPPTAYLARVSGAARARSDAYFEGGYWLQLVDLVYGLAVAGAAAVAEALRPPSATGPRSAPAAAPGQALIYVAAYVVIVTVGELAADAL